MINIELNESEVNIVVEALHFLLGAKNDAYRRYRKFKHSGEPFREEDFGIPGTNSVLMKIERFMLEETHE